jgi:prophage regulatory protein
VTGLPRATIYDKISKGKFPRPIKLGERSVGWLETEITEWQKARVVERDGVATGGRRDRLARDSASGLIRANTLAQTLASSTWLL